tara:strand:+ start:823 stop:1143 length:321 start_codon:yes stop_codon:yes gene_type:complete
LYSLVEIIEFFSIVSDFDVQYYEDNATVRKCFFNVISSWDCEDQKLERKSVRVKLFMARFVRNFVLLEGQSQVIIEISERHQTEGNNYSREFNLIDLHRQPSSPIS